MSPAVAGTVFALIVPAELVDKTLVATLVLATRFRPLAVWTGVAVAFAIQSGIAVAAGGLVALLPRRPVLAVTAALFLLGAALLLRHDDPATAEERRVADELRQLSTPPSWRRMALLSFGVLFAAEWGDLSQLLTASLAARYDDPIAVFVGSWLALAGTGALTIVGGRALLRVVGVQVVRLVSAGLFVLLAVATGVAAARA